MKKIDVTEEDDLLSEYDLKRLRVRKSGPAREYFPGHGLITPVGKFMRQMQMFNERKVAQMAAFYLGQVPECRMSHLKLMKLLYLADREAVRAFGFTMSGDRMVSMPHGPVLSMTLNLMDGDVESGVGGWEEWISDKENHELSLRQPLRVESLDELSPAEIEVLTAVWSTFGPMDQWEIRDWTHHNCAEWEDPRGSSYPISFERLALALGFNGSVVSELAARIQEEQEIDKLFAAL
ncbi:MAG: SocA family protein [Chromatiaceae bacterium]|nr:SocA family protein [Chromatiaceae bacterium]